MAFRLTMQDKTRMINGSIARMMQQIKTLRLHYSFYHENVVPGSVSSPEPRSKILDRKMFKTWEKDGEEEDNKVAGRPSDS